jgi:hypothetical protein
VASVPEVRVALIDSGVNAEHPHIRGLGELEFGPVLEAGAASNAPQADRLGHGTCACAAILDLAPGTRVLSLKVFDEQPLVEFDAVLQALWAALRWRADLVNLSLGSTEERWNQELGRIARAAAEQGARLIAPLLHNGLPSYPGSLAGFEGVVSDLQQPRERARRDLQRSPSPWFASPFPRELPGLPRERNLRGASFAVANVTGMLARELAEQRTRG